jgi:hypothetical protein
VFDSEVQWGHYRQKECARASVTLGPDDAVEIEMNVSWQDDSYY